MKLKFYITLLFMFYVIYPCFSQEKNYVEETAELDIETSFNLNIVEFLPLNSRQYEYKTCCDTIATLKLKNAKRKEVAFYLDRDHTLISVIINGEPIEPQVKVKSHIVIPINSLDSEIKVTTRKNNLDIIGNHYKSTKKSGFYTVSSPFPNIKPNKITWTTYTEKDLIFTGKTISHYEKTLREPFTKNIINSEKNFKSKSDFTQTFSDSNKSNYFNFRLSFIIFAIITAVAFLFLQGFKYIRNIFLWPFALLNFNSKTIAEGFTCIELLIVIVIIVVLSAMALPPNHGRGRRYGKVSREEHCFSNQTKYIGQKQITYQKKDDCPDFGIYKIENGKVFCNVHGNGEIYKEFKKKLLEGGYIKSNNDYYSIKEWQKNEIETNELGYANKLKIRDILIPYQIEIDKSTNYYKLELNKFSFIKEPIRLNLEFMTQGEIEFYKVVYIIAYVLLIICPFIFSCFVDEFLKSPDEKRIEKWNNR